MKKIDLKTILLWIGLIFAISSNSYAGKDGDVKLKTDGPSGSSEGRFPLPNSGGGTGSSQNSGYSIPTSSSGTVRAVEREVAHGYRAMNSLNESAKERMEERARLILSIEKNNLRDKETNSDTSSKNPLVSSSSLVSSSVIQDGLKPGGVLEGLKQFYDSLSENSEAKIIDIASNLGYERLLRLARDFQKFLCGSKTSLSCFSGETHVVMSNGELKEIRDVLVGDEVLSFNFISKKFQIKIVESIYEKEVNELLVLGIGGKFIKVTREHPFFLDLGNGSYKIVAAEDLKKNDLVLSENGRDRLSVIERVRLEDPIIVYDLRVKNEIGSLEDSNYCISDKKIIVHNCGVQLFSEAAFVKMLSSSCTLETAKCSSFLLADIIVSTGPGVIIAAPLSGLTIAECAEAFASCGLAGASAVAGSNIVNYLLSKNESSVGKTGIPKINGPSESIQWKEFKPYKEKTKVTGEGRDRRYYQWDRTHNDIEVYDRKGKHLGSMEPTTGEMYKPAVPGRIIDL